MIEIPKINSTIKVVYDYYGNKQEVTGIVFEHHTANYGKKEEVQITIASPNPPKTFNKEFCLVTVNMKDIKEIKPARLPKEVTDVLKEVMKSVAKRRKLQKKIKELQDTSNELYKTAEEKTDEVYKVYSTKSKDIEVWKKRIQTDLRNLNNNEDDEDDRRKVSIYFENLKSKKLTINVSFSREERLLNKEYEDRIILGQKVTPDMVKRYTPDRENSIKRVFDFCSAKINKITKHSNIEEKGWVTFTQSFEIEFAFDVATYEKLLAKIKEGFKYL